MSLTYDLFGNGKTALKASGSYYYATKITLENQKLVIRFGQNFTGDLEHWHYDTFRVKWRDQMQGKGFVNFKLNTQGKADVVSIENLSEFTRVPEPDPKAVTSATKN